MIRVDLFGGGVGGLDKMVMFSAYTQNNSCNMHDINFCIHVFTFPPFGESAPSPPSPTPGRRRYALSSNHRGKSALLLIFGSHISDITRQHHFPDAGIPLFVII